MKMLMKDKDGGPESTVWAYWLVEIKSLFSIALLKFVGESRDCYHNHAFNSISWVLKGELTERFLFNYKNKLIKIYKPSIIPIITKRETFHMVSSKDNTWVLTFRGRWIPYWMEFNKRDGTYGLTHGRIPLWPK